MSNKITSNNTGRQHIITISINDDNYIYADISNNKKKNIINMSDIDNCVTLSSVNDSIPIKQYNTANDGASSTVNDTPKIDKKILREKSIIPKKINNNPIGRNSKRLLLSGFKKLIFDIIYFSFIAIRLLYQFISNEIAKLILK